MVPITKFLAFATSFGQLGLSMRFLEATGLVGIIVVACAILQVFAQDRWKLW
jgi:hypothetical protein